MSYDPAQFDSTSHGKETEKMQLQTSSKRQKLA